MKRKIGIIIAILLCVVLVCTFAACNKDKNKNKNKTEDPTFTVTDTEKATMETKIGKYLDEWLSANAQEEGAFSDQKRAMKEDLNTQKAAFSFTNSKNEAINPVYDIKYAAATGKYTVTVTWTDGNGTPVTLTFVKDTVPAEYMGWAGNNSRVNDEWLIDNGKASDTLDALVAAGIKTINTVTGNAITGKFSADGVLGVSVAGKTYGLRVVGNLDGTTKLNNEIGLAIVDADGRALGGVYYKAATNVQDNKIYIQYATTGDDGNLIRDNDGNFTYSYKYINYADIFGFVKGVLPSDFPQANDGVLTFTDDDGEPIEIDGLTTLLAANDIDGSMVNMIVNMLAKSYKNGDRYYIDINLGSVLSQLSGLMSTINLDLSGFGIDLDAMGIDLANLSGLIGHITVSGKVSDEELTDIEVAVNIAKSKLYLNGKRGEGEKSINIPAISFAVYLEDFTFLSDDTIDEVIPAEALTAAEYFSPTNFDLSGDIHIVHTELNEQGEVDTDKSLDDTFHFEFVTDINLLEILENGSDSSAKAALVIKQSQGGTYDPDNCTNFLTITYEQADKLLCASGTAFGLDNGETLYSFQITSLDEAKKQIMLWLGLDTEHNNWHGVSSSFELLDYVLTSDTTFKANKTYYIKENGVYTEATVTVGEAVTANTYYVVPDTYASAKAIFGDSFVRALLLMIMGSGNNSGAVAEAAPDLTNIDAYIDAFKGIYDEFVTDGKIDVDLDGEDLAVKAEITADMINEVIDAINSTFSAELEHIANPKEVKFYLNYGETYNDKCFISVKYRDNTYELLFDDSVAGKFGIDFKVILKSNRVYELNFVAENGTNDWNVTVIFDIVKDGTAETPVIENHTAVTLSNFHGKWGTDNTTKIATLIPDAAAKAAALPIFPAEDIPSVGTQIAKGILKIFSNEKVRNYALLGVGFAMSFFAND